MKVSLEEFLRTGALGDLELGMSRAEVENVLGLPELWHVQTPNVQEAAIWKYGDVEFYFQNHQLWMIFMDDFDEVKGSSALRLDTWVISGRLTPKAAGHALNAARIDFQTHDYPVADNGVQIVTGAGAALIFAGEHKATLAVLSRQISPT